MSSDKTPAETKRMNMVRHQLGELEKKGDHSHTIKFVGGVAQLVKKPSQSTDSKNSNALPAKDPNPAPPLLPLN